MSENNEEDSLTIRIISGIEDSWFTNHGIFKWFFDNFDIEEEPIQIKNVYNTAYYITLHNLSDLAKLIENVNFEIIDVDFYIDEDTSYVQKCIVILGIDTELNDPYNLFNDISGESEYQVLTN